MSMNSLLDFIIDKNGTVALQAAQNRSKLCFFALKRFKYFLTLQTKTMLLQPLIFPIFAYGDVCYFDLNADLLNKLSTIALILQFVNSWLLMRTPMMPVTILATYLMFVLKLGPNYMQNRKPYHFPNIMTIYNAAQVIMSAYLIYANGRMLVSNGLLPKSCSLESEFNRQGIAAAMYYYLLAKVSELLDTVFFVLRKKDSQRSFLHIYHHTLMVVVTWCALKYEPTIHLMFLGAINSFVHVIMYTYYGLSAFPSLAKYLWWKKYITSLQLVQFIAVSSIFMAAYRYSDCTPSGILVAALLSNTILFLFLFGKFYVNTYSNNGLKAAKYNGIKNGIQNGNRISNTGIQNGKISNGNGTKHNLIGNERYSIYINDTKTVKRA